jgi:hypothetical protein
VVQYCPPSGGNGNFVVTLTNTGNGTATNIYITVNGSLSGPFSVTPGENQTHSFPLGTTADVQVQVTWVTDQGQQVLLLNTKVLKCPPVPTPTPTPTPSPSPTPTPTPSPTPTPPANHPPSGVLYVPVHRYVGSNDKGACVDNVVDPDGDPIKFTFKYVDAFGNDVGTMVGGPNAVWQQPGGAWCDTWIAPANPTQVTAYVTLDDGRPGGAVTYSDNFPVIANQTGT